MMIVYRIAFLCYAAGEMAIREMYGCSIPSK